LPVEREEAEMTKARILIALGVLAAFLAGSVFTEYLGSRLPATEPATAPVATPVSATRYVGEPRVTRVRVRHKRSREREVLIVAGSAGAGAAIGAAAKGGKGAAVGALAGGVGGLIYDLATRNR
jgi:uncharacterized protein YcfJ